MTWLSLDYSSPGLYRPFMLMRRVRNDVYRVTPPIYRKPTIAEIGIWDWWCPC